MTTLICNTEHRRERVRLHPVLNGLDFLEVGEDQKTLSVHFLGKAPVKLDKTQVVIEGGRRIRDIQVLKIKVITQDSVEFDDALQVTVDKAGDFSNYRLRVVEKNAQGEWQPHSDFDPRYDRIEFNFKADCPSDLDCKQETSICPGSHPVESQSAEPDINYLAKDYASFRQLILDRLALVMPSWQERHLPDIGIALVEVMAYVGDHLSYFQDAVATEAYLDTARKRTSVRRHARLVDYPMHEGCNARAWVCVQVSHNVLEIKADEIQFITGFNESLQSSGTVLTAEALRHFAASQYEVFEPVSRQAIQLYQDHNRIQFYTWGDQFCCLPRGTTHATLVGQWVSSDVEDSPDADDEAPACDSTTESETSSDQYTGSQSTLDTDAIVMRELHFKRGDVLIFEEVIGPETGHPQDANPEHRHAVRLTAIVADTDPLNHQPITHISWSEEDALPFPLCLSALGTAPECRPLNNISVACGNVVLVDHGRTLNEDLGEVPLGKIVETCQDEGRGTDSIFIPAAYSPVLKTFPLTFAEPLQDNQPAAHTLLQKVRRAVAKIQLGSETRSVSDAASPLQQAWESRLDLLASQADDFHFVAELDNEGLAHLRFGNDEMGRRPEAGMRFQASYRIGNGLAGNVGAEAISHVSFTSTALSGVSLVRNPMPAQGGIAAEPVSEVKLFAPHAFRKELQRAIVADDYAAIVLREFKSKVQNAVGKLRWNGSGYEVLVAIDVYGQAYAEPALLDEISGRLHRYRRMGHELVVKSAQRVPLDIELRVCVLPNYLRGHVKAELLQVFSNKRLMVGRLGFFHPDQLTFGKAVYLSKLVAATQSVEGVVSVTVTRMQRWREMANNEIENGVLPLGSFEIAQLDNDPGFPENGKLTLDMRGGR